MKQKIIENVSSHNEHGLKINNPVKVMMSMKQYSTKDWKRRTKKL